MEKTVYVLRMLLICIFHVSRG